MAFADPQSVPFPTLGTVSLPRVSESPNGEYLSSDSTVSLLVRHSRGNRTTSTASVKVSKVAADPYVTGVNRPVNCVVSVTVNRPVQGFTAAELLDVYKGLVANLAASTDTNIKKLIGIEK